MAHPVSLSQSLRHSFFLFNVLYPLFFAIIIHLLFIGNSYGVLLGPAGIITIITTTTTTTVIIIIIIIIIIKRLFTRSTLSSSSLWIAMEAGFPGEGSFP